VAQQGAGPPRPGRPPARGQRAGYWDFGGYEPQDEQGLSAGQAGPGSGPGLRDEGEDYPSWALPSEARQPRRSPYQTAPPGLQGSEDLQDPAAIDPIDGTPAGGYPPADPQAPPGARQPGRRRRAAPRPRLPLRARARAARARKTKRRVVTLGVLAAVAALIAVLVIVLPGSHPSPAGAAGFITTYQPGEFRSAPSACRSVQTATLTQYLPGNRSMVSLPNLPGTSANQCNWTLDQQPKYRLLEVTAQAYAPSGLATGNGSATAAATDAYAQALRSYQHPARGSHQPSALISTVPRLGSQAFSAFQVIKGGGDTTDRVTVVSRFRNVLITAEFNGLDHASRGHYGPVSPALLKAGATAAATDVLHKLS
jgi:hypothetical protein